MRVYWSLKSIPELAKLPPAERKGLWDAADNPRLLGTARWWAATIADWTMLPVGAALGLPAFSSPVAFGCLSAIGILVGVALGRLVRINLLASAVRPHLRWALGGVCPTCGYDLRATPDRCPECGMVPSPPAAARTK